MGGAVEGQDMAASRGGSPLPPPQQTLRTLHVDPLHVDPSDAPAAPSPAPAPAPAESQVAKVRRLLEENRRILSGSSKNVTASPGSASAKDSSALANDAKALQPSLSATAAETSFPASWFNNAKSTDMTSGDVEPAFKMDDDAADESKISLQHQERDHGHSVDPSAHEQENDRRNQTETSKTVLSGEVALVSDVESPQEETPSVGNRVGRPPDHSQAGSQDQCIQEESTTKCESEDKIELLQSRTSEDRASLETGAASTLSSISQIGTWSCGGSPYASRTSQRRTSAGASTARSPGLPSSKRLEIHPRSPRRMTPQVKVALHWIARKRRSALQANDHHHRCLEFCNESPALSGLNLDKSQSKLGLSLKGCTVEDIQPWGPAHVSDMIAVGDEILKIDDIPVEPGNIAEHIVGIHEPHSIIRLTVRRGDGSGIQEFEMPRYFSAFCGLSEILHQTLTELGEDIHQVHEALTGENVGVDAQQKQNLQSGLHRLEAVVDLVSAMHMFYYDERKHVLSKVLSMKDLESLSNIQSLLQSQDISVTSKPAEKVEEDLRAEKMRVEENLRAEKMKIMREEERKVAHTEMQSALQKLRAEFEEDLRNSLSGIEQHAALQEAQRVKEREREAAQRKVFLNKYEQDQEEKKKLKEQIQDHHQQITYLKQLTSLPPGAEELAAKDAVIKAKDVTLRERDAYIDDLHRQLATLKKDEQSLRKSVEAHELEYEMQAATARNLKAELLRRRDYFEKDQHLEDARKQLEDERVRSWALHYQAEIAQSQAVLEALGDNVRSGQPRSSGPESPSKTQSFGADRFLTPAEAARVDDRLVGAASSVNSLPGIMEEDLRPAEHGI